MFDVHPLCVKIPYASRSLGRATNGKVASRQTGANDAGCFAKSQHGALGIQFDPGYLGFFVFFLFFIFHKSLAQVVWLLVY